MSTSPVSWTPILETLLQTTAEKANCLYWLHNQSEILYNKRKAYIDIPVIVGSACIAFLNAGSSSLFKGESEMASISLGIASLAVGVINTIGTYFGWAKRAEAHRIGALHYSKLFRFLQVQLSLPQSERIPPNELLNTTKDTYDRLDETTPTIPPKIIDRFKQKFGIQKYEDVSKPTETNGLEKVLIYSDTGLQRSVSYSSEQSRVN